MADPPPPRPPLPPHRPAAAPLVSSDLQHLLASVPSPLPTPPSSTTAIPLCFPSPTSVADLADPHPRRRKHNVRPVPPDIHAVHSPDPHPSFHPAPHHDNLHLNPSQTSPPHHPQSQHQHQHQHQQKQQPQPSLADATAQLSLAPLSPNKPPADLPNANVNANAYASVNANANANANARPIHLSSDTHSSVSSVSSRTPSDLHSDQDPCDRSTHTAGSHSGSDCDRDRDRNCNRDHHREYGMYHLANVSPSSPLHPISKAQFVEALDTFRSYTPSNEQVSPPILASRLRLLLDHLDAINEQTSLRITNNLFDALSTPECLAMLLFLLSDISARSNPQLKDVRKTYRYPYLITHVLANGNQAIRDAFVNSPRLMAQLLSFLDADLPLSTGREHETPPPTPPMARENPLIVGNIVQILASYLETTSEQILPIFAQRPHFMRSLVNLLHIGSVPHLLSSLIPERCVQDVAAMDAACSFDRAMSNALSLLASSRVYHLLTDAFITATQTIFSVVTNSNNPTSDQQLRFTSSEQMAYNVTEVFSALVAKTIRAVRINTSLMSCRYLNVFANPDTASTLTRILRAGVELFRGTDQQHVSILDNALRLVIQVLRHAEDDRDRRVASVTGQPPLLDMRALEAELSPVLRNLMSVLIDCVGSEGRHASIRLQIMELFVQCSRVFPGGMVPLLDKLKFGAVAFKVMLRHPRNSLLHHAVCRAVETALISPYATSASAEHWLLHSKIIQRILKKWDAESGDVVWQDPRAMHHVPFLSGLVQMACCVQHYMAMHAGESDPVISIPESVLCRFNDFCSKSLKPILALEKTLCGPKPRRKANMSGMGGGLMGRSFGDMGSSRSWSATSSGSQRGSHLVASPSAHRFGFNPPMSSLRSRFDEVFVESGADEFESCSSGGSLFDNGDLSDSWDR